MTQREKAVERLLDQLLIEILFANHDPKSRVEVLLHSMDLRIKELQKLLGSEKTP